MPTSVPVWGSAPPELDVTGRSYAVLAFGAQADEVTRTWIEQLHRLGHPVQEHRVVEGDPSGVRWAQRQAGGARVGWRLCVAGPEADVLATCAAVRAQGAVDAEITAHAVSTRRKNVLCTHCRSTTTTDADVGCTCPCSGCGRELLVYHHVSRRHAGYMGFMADAEEQP
ncbi:dimethylamine monooxygenase subunit DmmA family protein [Kineococcus arenarius]|uniref:dimethylamine monooxygenase subunit DmmA family protein n=1 Tax=unclassified Kineococcus TaxID=2621656 RepID=UPI003D7CC660